MADPMDKMLDIVYFMGIKYLWYPKNMVKLFLMVQLKNFSTCTDNMEKKKTRVKSEEFNGD